MSQRISAIAKQIISLPWLPHAMSLAGGFVYLLNALQIARTKTSFLDEGLYLYKGYLFATGQQVPFADYGVWTNHAILSFLIPGYVQKWFGPGLETGRYFMIFLSLFTLLGLWVFARRWGNAWWAAGIVWAMALNPAEIKIHTLAISEGLVAATLVWILVLTIGEDRPLWQILLGASLTAPLVLTRENMAFVPPILFLYLLWQRGWKTGLLAALSAGIFFIAGNAFYFPDDLKFWAMRVPGSLAPLLKNWQMPNAGKIESLPLPEESNLYRMFLYFWLTFRLHFVALVGAVTVWLLWSPSTIRELMEESRTIFQHVILSRIAAKNLKFSMGNSDQKGDSSLPSVAQNDIQDSSQAVSQPLTERTRAAIFLSVLLLVLYIAHMQVSFFGEFCISCVLLYIGYFDFIGLMLLVIAAPLLPKELPRFRQALVFIVMALIILGIGFTTHEDLSTDFAKSMIERLDKVYLWNALLYFTKLPPLMAFRVTFVMLVSLLVILVGGIALGLGYRRLNRERNTGGKIGLVALNTFLIAGLILSPTGILGKGSDFFDCGGADVFASYEKAGQELSQVIQPGSTIYWEGRSLAIFLYLPDVKIYPPQMNHVHSYFMGGDADILLRFSRWNDELARKWLAEADYILVQNTEMVYLNDQILESGEYVKVMSTPKLERCRWQSVINVYQRVQP